MFKEFKKFISRGNVMDLAVGVIIGGAFQGIITSLVNDMLMPILTMLTGKVNFSELKFHLGTAEVSYGNFISAIINFLIISFVIFLMVKGMNKLNDANKASLEKISSNKFVKKFSKGEKVVEEEPETKLCPYCLSEIPYKAVKCAHCASDLEIVDKKKKAEK